MAVGDKSWPVEVVEEDAQILYRLTVDFITKGEGPERERAKVLLRKHIDALERRHGAADTRALMDAVTGRIDELLAEKKARK